MQDLVDDTTPQLGGNLDGQSTFHLVNFVNGTFSGTVIVDYLEVDTGVGSSLCPDTDNYYNLGSSTKKWRDAHIEHNLYLRHNLSDGTNTLTIANAKAAYDWGDHASGGYQAQGDILDDLNTLGVNTADSEFLVGTGAGALTWENAATARTSLGLGTIATFAGDQDLQEADSPTFAGLDVKQDVDSGGIKTYGFDDRIGNYLKTGINSSGQGFIDFGECASLLNLQAGGTLVGYFTGTFFAFQDDKRFRFGSSGSDHGLLMFGTAQTNNALMLGLPGTATSSFSLIVCSNYDAAFNFAHPDQASPTIFIHSDDQTTDEWTSITHNGTDGVITTGKGNLNLEPSGVVTLGDSSQMTTSAAPTADADIANKKYVDDQIAARRAYIKIQDKKAQNTQGGTFTAGDWRTRVLNDEESDTGDNAALSSNQITLAAGTYECRITAPAYQVKNHQARLYNTTGAATLLTGTITRTEGTIMSHSVVVGRFTIAASQALEVQHYCNTTIATIGFGERANFTDEIYTVAEFWRIS